jgi:hypothetical protein
MYRASIGTNFHLLLAIFPFNMPLGKLEDAAAVAEREHFETVTV